MIRPFTCLAVLLAAGSGLYLYSEKHRTTLLDQRIDKVVSDTDAIRARTSMLQAEWALLNQPDRLGALAARFLPALQPIAPSQFVQLADLDRHLPPIGAPAAPPAPAAAPNAGPAAPAPAATPDAPLLLSAATARPPDHAVREALADPAAAEPTSHPTAPRHPPRSHRTTLLASLPARPEATEAPPVRHLVSYARPAPMLASAWSRPRLVADARPAPAFTGSALGMAHDAMAPPMAAPVR